VAAFAEAWPPLAALVAAALPGSAAAGAGLRAEAARCCTQALRADEAAAASALPAVARAAGAAFALPGGHAFAAPLAASLDLLARWRAGRGLQRGRPLPAPLVPKGARAARLLLPACPVRVRARWRRPAATPQHSWRSAAAQHQPRPGARACAWVPPPCLEHKRQSPQWA